MSSTSLTLDSNGPFINDRFVLSFGAQSALAPGTVVKFVSSQTVDTVSQTTETAVGVVWDAAFAGRPVNVITRGVVLVTSDNAVTAGDLLTAGASGQFHSLGASWLIAVASTIPMVRAQALATQATAGNTFLAMVY